MSVGAAGAEVDRALPALGAGRRTAIAVLLVLAACGLLTFGLTVRARVAFPWPLEWMEGATLQHALRLLHARPLYAAPSAEFIPYLYPPLAYLPMAAAAALLGPSLSAARIAALGCSLGALLCLGRAAARGAGHASAGWFAAGLFALGFGYTGAFLDLARVDACFVLLIALAAERLLAGRTRAALVWLALSAFAKQHGVLLLLAVSLAIAGRAWRARELGGRAPLRALLRSGELRSVGLSCGLLLLGYAALELATAGWFGRYTLALPLRHGAAEPGLFASFFAVDLLLYLPVLTIAAAWDLGRRLRRPTPFDALVLAAAVASALGRAHAGGHDNVRLPAFALLCIAGVVPLCQAALAAASRPRTRAAACALLALQCAMLWQAPAVHAPPPASAPRFAALRAALARCAHGGSTVALDHALLGDEPFVHTMALSDLRMGDNAELARAGTDALLAALGGPQAPAAIAVGERFPPLVAVLARHYRRCAELPAPPLATGYQPGVGRGSARMQIVFTRQAR